MHQGSSRYKVYERTFDGRETNHFTTDSPLITVKYEGPKGEIPVSSSKHEGIKIFIYWDFFPELNHLVRN